MSGGTAVTAGDLRFYVVNLRRRPERRRRMERLLPDELDVTFTSDWDGPFDGRELDREVLAESGYRLFPWRISSSNPWWNRVLTWGEVGCAVSHLACWRDAAATGVPFVVVLEDDVVLCPSFLQTLLIELRRPFDLLYLGRCPRGADRRLADGIVSPGFSYSAFGYVLSERGLAGVLEAGFDQAILPVDEFLPAMYVEHPREDVRTRFPPRLSALAFDPPLVEHVGTLSDTRHAAPAT